MKNKIEGVKKDMKKFLMRYSPFLAKKLISIYHRYENLKHDLQVKINTFSHDYELPSPDEIYWIDPDRITYHTDYGSDKNMKDRVFDKVKDKGKVYDGDWDKTDFKFTDLDVYQGFEDRIKKNKPWDETEFFEISISRLENEGVVWGCRNEKELREHFEYLDKLINNIREEGYFSQEEISDELSFNKKEEVTVNIGRDGDFLFQDGRHRLSIAKILGIEKIPVQILVRHERWVKFRENVIELAENEGGLEQPLLHPDLNDIPAKKECEERFDAIRKDLEIEEGMVLDLGTNLGYFCHKFEDIGFDCIGLEEDIKKHEIAEKVKIAEGKNFELIYGDILEEDAINKIKNNHFEVVLALDRFNHFLENEESYKKIKNLLKQLNMEVMYLGETKLEEGYKNHSEQELVDFILSETRLNHKEEIYKDKDGKRIFRLY